MTGNALRWCNLGSAWITRSRSRGDAAFVITQAIRQKTTVASSRRLNNSRARPTCRTKSAVAQAGLAWGVPLLHGGWSQAPSQVSWCCCTLRVAHVPADTPLSAFLTASHLRWRQVLLHSLPLSQSLHQQCPQPCPQPCPPPCRRPLPLRPLRPRRPNHRRYHRHNSS